MNETEEVVNRLTKLAELTLAAGGGREEFQKSVTSLLKDTLSTACDAVRREDVGIGDAFVEECRQGIKENAHKPEDVLVLIHQRDAACALTARIEARLGTVPKDRYAEGVESSKPDCCVRLESDVVETGITYVYGGTEGNHQAALNALWEHRVHVHPISQPVEKECQQ